MLDGEQNEGVVPQEAYLERDSEEIDPNNSFLLDREGENPLQEEREEEENKNEEENEEWEEFDLEWRPNWVNEYQLRPGPTQLPPETETPLQYFALFFNDELLEVITNQTNLYADQFFLKYPEKRNSQFYRDWRPCTKAQVQGYLGLIIHMGIVKLPRLEYHWRKDSLYNCSLCSNIMTRLEFLRIHSFLHLANNERANHDDMLYKIRPIINMLSGSFQRHYILNKEVTIDEKMIKYSGRISFLQYVRNKPVKLGFKVFVLSDAISGYVYNWRFYTGKENNARVSNLAHNIVLSLVQGLENRNHHLYFDSYYSSIPIVKELGIKGFGCTGMINQRKRLIPEAIKNPTQELQDGETISRRLGNTVLLLHKDRKEIRVITSIHGRQLANNGRPVALENYNFYMRGVDKGNQQASYYHPNHKSMK